MLLNKGCLWQQYTCWPPKCSGQQPTPQPSAPDTQMFCRKETSVSLEIQSFPHQPTGERLMRCDEHCYQVIKDKWTLTQKQGLVSAPLLGPGVQKPKTDGEHNGWC